VAIVSCLTTGNINGKKKSLSGMTTQFRVNHVDKSGTRCKQHDVNQQLYQRHASISKTKWGVVVMPHFLISNIKPLPGSIIMRSVDESDNCAL
tara:strand:- start:325 stop:603 length:279 start_codon:yes stop_codon:yes gene_type:complete